MESFQEKSEIIKVEQLTDDVIRLTLHSQAIAKATLPGQFVMIKVSGGHDPLLRRPFSLHRTDGKETVQILYKVLGRGTKILSEFCAGQKLDIVGPLGHGFTIKKDKPTCLVGGGMGIAPLLFLADTMLNSLEPQNIIVLLGAQTKAELEPLAGGFEKLGLVVETATDDGSLGHHGFVIDLMDKFETDPSREMYACGPYPMMRAVARKSEILGWNCQVSLETMMACGLAACLGCAYPRKYGSGYVHVCKDGPVFDSEEVLWL